MNKLRINLILAFALIITQSFATIYTTVQDGDWNEEYT